MNRFNKRQGTLLKKRRELARVVKKRKGVAQLHRTVAQASSGKRTGKSAKKRERAVRLKVTSCKAQRAAGTLYALRLQHVLEGRCCDRRRRSYQRRGC